jgi:spermidine synthase
VTVVLGLCFFLSGAAALGLEVLWVRSAGLLFGATVTTAGIVLALYFAGLGLGAALARRGSPDPVRRYALLELGAAAGALWSAAVFCMPSPAASRILVLAAAIAPATICLGATLPALGEAVAADAAGSRGGVLYALNTAGGALGIAAMGFGLPALIGVRACYVAAAAACATAGVVALRCAGGVASSAPAAHAPATRASIGRLRAIAAAAGAMGLGLEVLWIRLFAQVLHNSVYSFAAVTLVFLVALASGAALGAFALRRVGPVTVAAGALLLASIGTVGGFWIFVALTDGLRYVGMQTGLAEYLGRIVALGAMTAGPAALGSGALLPALWASFPAPATSARPLGDLTAANTFGSVVGALSASFVVLPVIGLRGGLLLSAAGYLVCADAIGPRRWRPLVAAALITVVLGDPLRASLAHLTPGETLRAATEGPAGVVTVVETGSDRQLRLDGYYVLGGSAAAANERRQGLLPLLLHPAPRRAAFIGMATGITASAAPSLGLEETTVVELVPEVAAAAAAEFATWNGDLLARPDVRLIIDDGRRHLMTSADRYDVVVSDLFIPWHAGAGTLWAHETFTAAARRLAPDGLFCQWLPLYQLTRDEFDVIARTFLASFPTVTVWRDDFYPDRPLLALVGRATPLAVDPDTVSRRIARLPEGSGDAVVSGVRGLAMLYVGDLSAAPDLIPPGPINSDDRPLIEFLAPRLTRMTAVGDKDWFTGESLAVFTEALAARTPAGTTFPADDDIASARRAGAALYRYALAQRRGDDVAAARFEAEVRRLVPDVVAAGEKSASVAALADARRSLGSLRDEQDRLRRDLETIERRLGELSAASER